MSKLPDGFTLDEPTKSKPAAIPAGFVLDGSADEQAPPQKPEAHPFLSGVLSFAKGADDALMGLPHEAATALRAATHGESLGQARQDIDAATNAATKAHPIAHGAGVISGIGATLPLMPEAAPTWVGRAAQGAKIGAGMSGVSELTDSHDPLKAAGAAIVGGAVGGAASPVLEIGGKIVKEAVKPVVGILKPDLVGANAVRTAIADDAAVGGQGLSPQQWLEAKNGGSPVVLADLGGEKTRNLARAAANYSDEGRQALKNVTETRFDTQGERFQNVIDKTGVSNFEKQEILKEEARKQNKPLYDKAYAYSDAKGLWNDELAGLLNSPDFKTAIADAERRAANKAAIDGTKAVKNPFALDADGNYVLRPDSNGNLALPNLRFWDVVKQNLDEKIGQAKRSGGDIRDLTALKQKFVGLLDQGNPYYAQARGSAQRFFGAENAVDAGAEFLKSTAENAAARKAISQMNPAERKLFSDGFATALTDKIANIGDRRDVANLFRNGKTREKIEIALGKQQAAKLEAQTYVETVMQQLKNGVGGNSTTVQQAIAGGLVGGGSLLAGNDTSTSGLVAAAAFHGKGIASKRVAEQVAKFLTSSNPDDVLKVVKMAQGSKNVMDTLRKMSTLISAGSGRAAHGLGVIDISK